MTAKKPIVHHLKLDPPPERSSDSWILTVSGRAFDYAEPKPEQVSIEDIAHGLALECRFANQCREHYSVAQHSIIIAGHMYRKGSAGPALEALLHDAAEAYLGDWPRPLKLLMGDAFKRIERRIEEAIIKALGLEKVVIPGGGGAVKRLDRRALATERRDLMALVGKHGARPWVACEQVEPFDERIKPWPAERAERSWLLMYETLKRELDSNLKRAHDWQRNHRDDLGLRICSRCQATENTSTPPTCPGASS